MSDIDSSSITKLHVSIDRPGRRAIDWLAEGAELSRGQLKDAMQKGAVWLTRNRATQRLRRASRELSLGDQLHLYYDPHVLAQTAPAAKLIADEGDYSVWYKACGMLCQGSKFADHTTVQRWVQQHLVPERPCFSVHRLDRATEGLVIIAHSKSAVRALTSMFEARQVEKQYLAVVRGELDLADELVTAPVDGKPARSRFTTRAIDGPGQFSLLQVLLETGRKHQIRQHLLSLGCPILGDRLYGNGLVDGCDLQLQAFSLIFRCPLTGLERSYRLAPEEQLRLPDRGTKR